MEKLKDIPAIRNLGCLPALSDWHVKARTWTISGGIHHQFSISHSSGWLYEYRCRDDGTFLESYWSPRPKNTMLQNIVESEFDEILANDWSRMTEGTLRQFRLDNRTIY